MTMQLEVEVAIRKGLGAQFIHKHFPMGFDDLPQTTTKYEIEQMAKQEVERYLRNTDDYRSYGKNWEIVAYHYT